jgi:tRNA(adenine34) deaminase
MPADTLYMQLALAQARHAAAAGEVPVGAVLVHQGEIIGTGHNTPIAGHDPTAHAEIRALRDAAQKLGNYRLEDCELYVTLEPCPMCAGAMLHARLKRVVFGATDPKTGAAGSVVNLFSQPQLNHHTQVRGGVLAEECGGLLQEFFRARREIQRLLSQPVRDDAVRTPDAAFEGLPPSVAHAHYVSDWPGLQGLRVHYLSAGPSDAPLTWLFLHGHPGWSEQFNGWFAPLIAAGHRVVALDLPGYGRSDKPKKDAAHSARQQREWVLACVSQLDLNRVVIVGKDWGALMALSLPAALPGRVRGVVAMDATWPLNKLSPAWEAWSERCARKAEGGLTAQSLWGEADATPIERRYLEAPFPDRGHRAVLRAFPRLMHEVFNDAAWGDLQALATYWDTAPEGQGLWLSSPRARGMHPPALPHSLRAVPMPVTGAAEQAHALVEIASRHFAT